jgi:RimJ/RimL family protein N-acetyltransferase
MEAVELRTKRLLLRPFTLADVDDVLRYASDKEWRRYLLAAPDVYTREDAERFVSQAVQTSWETRPVFAIEHGGSVIGGINLRIKGDHKRAELGYSIAREHWGQGMTVEAARAVVDWAFGAYGLLKVFAKADSRNVQSIRVMEKLGMTREGQLREHRLFRGEAVDEVLYGLLLAEWATGQK